MLLIVLAALLVVIILYVQASQGLYSALVMAILTVLCAAAAFNYFEPVASMLAGIGTAYADAVALALLFAVPLLVARIVIDHFMPANVVVGPWISRVAGGALGLLSALVLVGVLTIIVQMLPLGANPLGYAPFDDTLQPDQTLKPFCPDQFTLGLIDTLSGGSLKAEPLHPFSAAHDNLLLELFCARNQLLQTRKVETENVIEAFGRVDAEPQCLRVNEAHFFTPASSTPGSDFAVDSNLLPPDPLMPRDKFSRIVVVRTVIDNTACDKDLWWRLPATHFRLVARREDGSISSHYPLAYLTGREAIADNEPSEAWRAFPAPLSSGGLPQIAKLGVMRLSSADQPKLTVDWIYRVGADEAPAYMVFRRAAQAAIPDPNAAPNTFPPAKDALVRKLPM